MAMSPTGPLERATDAARAEQPEEWETVSAAVKRRVRATVLPARQVVVVAADGSTAQDTLGSRTYVSSRVVRARLREALHTGPDLAAERLDLTIDDDDRLTRVELDLVCAYGTDVLPRPASPERWSRRSSARRSVQAPERRSTSRSPTSCPATCG